MSTQTRWSLHWPRERKVVADRTPARETALPSRMNRCRKQARVDVAAAPAALVVHFPPLACDAVRSGGQDACAQSAAQRLASGRTEEVYQLLADTRLFHWDGVDSLPVRGGAALPGRGLQATCEGAPVYILDTLSRRGKRLSDVAIIRARGGGREDESILGRTKGTPARV